MGKKSMMNRRVLRVLAWGILFLSLCLGSAGISVKAEGQRFIIDAEVLPSNKGAYEVQLTVENQGLDWEGTVRLTSDAYNQKRRRAEKGCRKCSPGYAK